MKDLNFFIPYQGQKKEKVNTQIYIYGAITIVGILIVSTLVFNTLKILTLDNSIKDYTSKLQTSEMKTKMEQAEKINTEISLLSQYDTSLNKIAVSVKERDNVSKELLEELTSTLPSNVFFEDVDIVDNTISINGIASDRTEIAELKHNLSDIPIMEDVYVDSIDYKLNNKDTSNGKYSFDIKCVLKDVE